MVKSLRVGWFIRESRKFKTCAHNIVATTQRKFGITPQAVYKHLDKLRLERIILNKKDTTKHAIYELAPLIEFRQVYLLSPDFIEEDVVWRGDIQQHWDRCDRQ